MTVDIISLSVSMKVLERVGIEFATPGSTVGLSTDCSQLYRMAKLPINGIPAIRQF